MNAGELISSLLSNGNGKRSSTRFAYFSIVIAAIVLVLCCCFAIVYYPLRSDKNTFENFAGIAEVILAAAALVLSAGVPKALSDKFQSPKKQVNKPINQQEKDD